MLTDEQVKAIRFAVDTIHDKVINKIEGIGYIVYRVGNIIRVDIKDK